MSVSAWVGPTSRVLETLRHLKADTDENGQFLIQDPRGCLGIGGDEAVLSREARCFVDGEPVEFVGRLGGGVGITVI